MANLETKGSLSPALSGVQTALSIIAHGLERHDETRLIFEEKDFLLDCFNEEGRVDSDRLKDCLGDYIAIGDEDVAKRYEQKLRNANISHCVMDVLKKDDSNPIKQMSLREAKEASKDLEIKAKTETWFMFPKKAERNAQKILHELEDSLKEKRFPIEQMIKASKSPVKPFEISIMDGIDNKIVSAMEKNHLMARFYSVIEGPVKSSIVFPSIYKNEISKNLMMCIGHTSGKEQDDRAKEKQNTYAYENRHLSRAVDDRKPFFIANLSEDGKTFNEGVVIDANGSRRLVFEKNKTYVVEYYPRNLNSFTAYTAGLIGKYKNPGYLELTGRSIQRDDIMKNRDKIVPDKEMRIGKTVDALAVSHKNYLIQHYIVPIMEMEISGTTREEVLGRIRSAKWHALENGLYCEAQELGKDEAEGSASTSSKTKGTMRGVDLGTVNHEGFDLTDDLYYGTKTELAHAIGLTDREIEKIGFLKVDDPNLDHILKARPEVKKEVIQEIGEFYKAVEKNGEIRYTEILPSELELLLSQDKELDLGLEIDIEEKSKENDKRLEDQQELGDDEPEL